MQGPIVMLTAREDVLDLYLHDDLQVCAPDLLGFGRGAGVHFAGVPCCTTTTHDGSSRNEEAGGLKGFLNRHLPTTPWTGVTTASRTFRTSTTALSFRTVLWIHTRKF